MNEAVFVYRTGSLGDTLVALPAIMSIAKVHAGHPLILVTNTPAREGLVTGWDVARHSGLFEDVVFYDKADARSLARIAWVARARRARRLYYLVDKLAFRHRLRDRLFFEGVCGFKELVALPMVRDGRARFDADGRLLREPRASDRMIAVVEPASRAPIAPKPPLLFAPPNVRRVVDALLAGSPPMLVGFGIGSKMSAKRWPLGRFVEVARRLAAHRPSLGFVMFGSADERADCEAFAQAVGPQRVLNLAGQTDVITSAEALRRCAFYVGNDTGTMHLAAIMGRPTVSIFSARDVPGRWEPYGDGHVVLRKEVPCAGCKLETCVEMKMKCLDLITVDEVWESVRAMTDWAGFHIDAQRAATGN